MIAEVRVFEKDDPGAWASVEPSEDLAGRQVVALSARDYDGQGLVWLTPKRARKLAKWLKRMADQVAAIEGEEV